MSEHRGVTHHCPFLTSCLLHAWIQFDEIFEVKVTDVFGDSHLDITITIPNLLQSLLQAKTFISFEDKSHHVSQFPLSDLRVRAHELTQRDLLECLFVMIQGWNLKGDLRGCAVIALQALSEGVPLRGARVAGTSQ